MVDPCRPLCKAGGCGGDGSCATLQKRTVPSPEWLSVNVSERLSSHSGLQKRTLEALANDLDYIGNYYNNMLEAKAGNFEEVWVPGTKSGMLACKILS